MTKAAPADWHQVFVRHVVVDRRADVTCLSSIVKPTFKSSSSGSAGAGSGIWAKPRGRWLIGVGFPDTDWVPLFTNHGTAQELFAGNSGNKRLEVVLAGYDSQETGWFFWLNQGGKPKVRFSQSPDAGSQPQIDADAAIRELLAACPSAHARWQTLCQQFHVPEKTRTIVPQDDEFVVLGKSGRPVKALTRGVISHHGPEIAIGENRAADQLNRAIEIGDAQAVRQAVAAGASLETRPGSSVSPLLSALFKWFEPGSQQVAATLLELGAAPDGRDAKDPPLINLMQNFVREEMSLPAAEFLLQHGANVNATDSGGKTALFSAVISQKQQCVALLMQHGADPHLGGTLEWLQKRMEETSNITKLEPLGQVLELLTGNAWQPPTVPELAPELKAENDRFRQVHELWQIERILKNGFQIRRSRNTELKHDPTVQLWSEQLKQQGFQRSCQIDLWLGASCRSYLVFTDPQRNVDALITISGEQAPQPKLDLGVYHPGLQLTTVSNRERESFLGYVHPGNDFTCLSDVDALQLIPFLEQKLAVTSQEVLPLTPESFETRYRELMEVELQGLLAHLQTILNTPPETDGKVIPRHERLHCYLRGSSDNDPTWSTATITDHALKSLADRTDPLSLPYAVRSAVDLMLLQHIQVAGAPPNHDYLATGCQRAVELFELEATASKPYHHHGLVEELEEALLLTTVAGDWAAFTRLCEALRPRFAHPGQCLPDSPTLEVAQFWLVVASAFRKKAIQGVSKLPEQIRSIRKRRYPLLLKVWEAIEARSQQTFEAALQASLQHQSAQHNRADSLSDLRPLLAIPESILYQIALHYGLAPCELPKNLVDRLVSPASIGLR